MGIISRGIGLAALGMVAYDAHYLGKVKSDLYASEKDASSTGYYLNNSMYSDSMSKVQERVRTLSFTTELDQMWKRFLNEPIGYIKGFTSMLVMCNPKMFKYEWIWVKDSGTGHLNSKFAPMKKHENILVFSKSAACFVKNCDNAMVYHPQMERGKPYTQKSGRPSLNYDAANCYQVVTENKGERYPVDIIKFNRDKERLHPTQKPVALLEYLVKTYSNEGETILDNCSGSGTLAVACHNTKRHYICMEKDENYYNLSVERMKKFKMKKRLF